ncbi:MAG: hypothetical protein IJ745_02120 [Bacteroidales bacterium]|nr:hypothetical protein [Bacteroidales bacterium]
MSKKIVLSILLLFCTVGSHVWCQEVSNITVLESDSRFAVFSVQAKAPKEGDVVSAALHGLFLTLLDTGVEGIANGSPLMQNQNAKWKSNFLKEKNPPYMTYVKGIYSEGDPVKNSVGQYEGTVLVRVNIDFLFRQLKVYGIMNE